MTSLAAIIPTFSRATLLERTLVSLCDCALPANFQKIIIAENGPKGDAEEITARFKGRLPIIYHYTPKPNKSCALNEVLKLRPADFIIFFDDDIRADTKIFEAYAREVSNQHSGFFIGGKIEIDYELEPPDWLKKYLPPSAVGWNLGEEKCPIGGPYAMGANWGAFVAELTAVGNFDLKFGPGTNARGQETTMQKKLLSNGVNGIYLPNAVVWHYVPEERCSPQWALDRVRQLAVRIGTELRHASLLGQVRRIPMFRLHRTLLKWIINPATLDLTQSRQFARAYKLQWYEGILIGYSKPCAPIALRSLHANDSSKASV